MEKIKMQTGSGVTKNIDKILSLFPDCVAETTDVQGNVYRGVDFEKLQEELTDSIIGTSKERYQFTWPDKRKAIHIANTKTTNTLRPDRNSSVDFDSTNNLYIEGDNLEALKLLRDNYLGKIKLVYLDPPYNTGKDFVYRDNFKIDSNEFDIKNNNVDEEGNRLVVNSESNGRYHTDWLNMMYPRLKVVRDLLSDDGVVFISIDDNEEKNVRRLCDEIFGEDNFVGQLILKTATDNNPSQINIEHEYMICYAKDKQNQTNWERVSEAANKIKAQYAMLKGQGLSVDDIQSELRKWIKAHKEDLPQVAHYNNVDEKGVYSSSSNSSNPHPGGYMFDIKHPVTGGICPKPQNGWRWPESTFMEYAKNGEVEWGKDHTTQPHIKKRIETSVEYLRSLIYEDNRATTKMLMDMFDGVKVFDNPKPVGVLSRIIDFVTDKDSIVLDIFSGSATTAHSVMQLNAEDGGKRKFIMVQIPEECDVKSEAYKAGYRTICEIGEERIRRSGKKIIEDMGNALETEKFDKGFRLLRVDTSNMKDLYYTPDNTSVDLFSVESVKEDRSAEDLLFQIMPQFDIEYSEDIQKKEINGKTVYFVKGNYLAACFDEELNDEVITKIAQRKPFNFVMRDSSVASDSVLDNFEQLFKTYSEGTKCMVI